MTKSETKLVDFYRTVSFLLKKTALRLSNIPNSHSNQSIHIVFRYFNLCSFLTADIFYLLSHLCLNIVVVLDSLVWFKTARKKKVKWYTHFIFGSINCRNGCTKIWRREVKDAKMILLLQFPTWVFKGPNLQY